MARLFSWRKLFGRILRSSSGSRRAARSRKPYGPLYLEELESRFLPATTLSIADSSVLEPTPHGTVNLDFTVTRTGDLTSQLTVGYTTVAGTAQANTDFTPMTGTTTFASGSATATIAIPVFGNGVYNNPSLTFSVQLTGIVNVVGPPVTFANQATFGTGSGLRAMAVGDLNGDGKPDVVIANNGGFSSMVSVLMNTTPPGATTPSFTTPQTFATGFSAYAAALADINGDGKPDLLVTNYTSGTVSVLLNTTAPGATTASFAAQQTFALGSGPMSLAVGDVNGDGKPDLSVVNFGQKTVSVLVNTTASGASTVSFASRQTFATGNFPVFLALADLNGDGTPDLVVTNRNDNDVSVLLNTTTPGAITASFAAQQTFATGSQPFSVAVGDVNGDGKPDLVVANNAPSGSVSVLLNTTAPGATVFTFASQQTFATGTSSYSVALGDLNGDGKPDIVVANRDANTASVLVNTTAPGATTASFAAQQTFATGGQPKAVALADVNGDGQADVIVGNAGTSTVSVLLNTTVLGAATVTPAFPQAATPAVGTDPISVALGDLNGNGKPDLVVTNRKDSTVSVFLNTTAPGATAPTFAAQQTFAAGSFDQAVALGDLTGDGKLDVVTGNENGTVSVLLNTTVPGTTVASFASQQTFAADSLLPYSPAIGDLNGDGMPDLVVPGGGSGSAVAVLLNTTAPGATTVSFTAPQTFAADSGADLVALADVNGDGKPDLVVGNRSGGTVSVLLNTTTPGATTASFAGPQNFAAGTSPYALAVGDVNGDGLPDVVVTNGNAKTASVLVNTTAPGATTASFTAPQTFAVGSHPFSVALGDVNGDGKPDLVVVNFSDATASVLLNTTTPGSTTASFTAQQTFATGNVPEGVALGDLNGDGRLDIVNGNREDNTVSVLLNTPATITRSQATGTITESDPPPTLQFSAASESVNENAGTFSLTVTLSAASGLATSVPFSLGGTAVVGTDFSGPTASPLMIPAGQTSGTITGTLINDNKFGTPNKMLTVTLGTPTNATLGSPATNTLTIVEATAPPTVQFTAASESINEDAGTFSLTVTLSAASTVATTIPFTLGGTAVSGTDYSGVTSPLVIAAGQTTGAITGTLINNGLVHPNKTLVVTLGTPTNATLGATTANTLTIVATFTVTTTADNGPGSLRQAILNVNQTPGSDLIDFKIGTGGVQAIALASPLPFLSVPVLLDGTTEPGFAGTPLIVVNGSGAGGGNGLVLIGGNSTVKGLVLDNFNASAAALELASSNNTVQGDFIGTDASGTVAAGSYYGIYLPAGSAHNTIGGTTAATRNVISGNSAFGVLLEGSGTSGNVVQGNFIGTNAAGSAALPNGLDGVALSSAANNTIGGTAAATGNILSGNARFGIFLTGSGTTGNVVLGNTMGLNAAGTTALPNAFDGVAIFGGASGNTIGGSGGGAGNVLSGNGRFGLYLSDNGTSGNAVQGNLIGVNFAGTVVLPNTFDGVAILSGAASNTIGGTAAAARNVISGNGRNGVLIGVTGTAHNVVQGNFIGTDATGTLTLGNVADGVALGTGASSNTVGGTVAGAGNTIANNGGAGVVVGFSNSDSTTVGDAILGNAIHSNGGPTGLGIDLGGQGHTVADGSGPNGPNHFANFPTASMAVANGNGSVTLKFTFTGLASSTIRLEFFLNNAGDTSQGRFFLGTVAVTTDSSGAPASVTGGGTIAAGVVTVTLTPPGGVTAASGQRLTATATLQSTGGSSGTVGDSSEFSFPGLTLT